MLLNATPINTGAVNGPAGSFAELIASGEIGFDLASYASVVIRGAVTGAFDVSVLATGGAASAEFLGDVSGELELAGEVFAATLVKAAAAGELTWSVTSEGALLIFGDAEGRIEWAFNATAGNIALRAARDDEVLFIPNRQREFSISLRR